LSAFVDFLECGGQLVLGGILEDFEEMLGVCGTVDEMGDGA
jgi:hypothetical protein